MTVAAGTVETAPSSRAVEALSRRLQVVAGVLVPSSAPEQDRRGAVDLLPELVAAVRLTPTYERTWLLLTAVAGRFADERAVDDARALLPGCGVTDGVVWLLAWALRVARPRDAERDLELLSGVVVDTGWLGPGASRSGLPHGWLPPAELGAGDVTWVGWWPGAAGLRPAPALVDSSVGDSPDPASDAGPAEPEVMCVPWGCVVLLPDPAVYTAAARRRHELALASAPAVTVGYGAVRTSVVAPRRAPGRVTGAGPRPARGQVVSDDPIARLAAAPHDATSWREKAVDSWLLGAVPAPRRLSERAGSLARRQLEGRAIAGPLRKVVVRVRTGLRS